MRMKTFLLNIQDDPGYEARLQAALDLARAFSGHLTCLQATSPDIAVGYDSTSGLFIMESLLTAIEKQRAMLRQRTERRLAEEDVNWNYLEQSSEPFAALSGESHLSDLIILGHPAQQSRRGSADAFIGDVLSRVRIPVLVIPDTIKGFRTGGIAMVAWNGSREAAQALRAAVPLLRKAKTVHLVQVEEHGDDRFPSTAAAEYLARHGVRSEIHERKVYKSQIELELMLQSKTLAADYVVMGAFGRSRAREFLFGGVTRHMLHESALPLLLAH
jgi:nucleotide-binding universal stress UspA family protein